MAKDPCAKKIKRASDGAINEADAQNLLSRLDRVSRIISEAKGQNIEKSLKEAAAEADVAIRIDQVQKQRAHLLNIKARRNVKSFAKRFATLGEGLQAYLEGGSKLVAGARFSVDYQAKATHQKYLGRMLDQLEKDDLWTIFKSGTIEREIYQEIEARGKGTPGVTKNEAARKIADVIEGITDEMASRQNQSGAHIQKLPGYITRQTHDQVEIRRIGGGGMGPENISRSFKTWMEFTLPRLDAKKTFKGDKPAAVMENIHRSLYTGVHGPKHGEGSLVTNMSPLGSVGDKVSQARVLHFKDAQSAYEYNQMFGMRSLHDQVMNDIHIRARSIAMMENFGPDADSNFDRIIRELEEEVRDTKSVAEMGMSNKSVVGDVGAQADSLRRKAIRHAYDIVSGKVDVPVNHGLARAGMAIRTMAILSKMTNVVLSAFSDKAFMHSELAYQGISQLDRIGAQFKALIGTNDPEKKQMLRLMGAALDGVIGSTITRVTSHSTVTGVGHKLQKLLFKVNFLNWWTDGHKSAAAELMSAHLGDHSDLKFDALPHELQRVLGLYEIGMEEWDAIRTGLWSRKDVGDSNPEVDMYEAKYITPDKLRESLLKNPNLLNPILEKRKLANNPTNIARVIDDLETRLRVYFDDRVDFAIPTPGAKEKRYTIWGDTRPGTPLGESARMLMMFKSFPITIMSKIWGRQKNGFGAENMRDWLMHPNKGFFNTAVLLASTMAMGYLSGAVRDVLKGRTPKRLTTDEGAIDTRVLLDAMQRGGGMGILGEFLFNEYDRHYRSASSVLAGPVVGQLDPLAEMLSLGARGEVDEALRKSEKFFLNNAPFINLFYIRPVLDYMVFWSLQEAMDPGSLQRMETGVTTRNNQGFWFKPSEAVK